MTDSSSGSGRNPVEALAEDFLRRQRGGERPTLEEYCRRHPELADDIREVFPVLIRMEDLRSDGPDDSTGGMAVHTATRLERLGDYRILREVGRGGMGVVYEAEQESLGRRVALKVLPDAALADAQQVQRFQREARAAARLHHTNIVPVFGVGRDDGHHYYVMQFIPGMGLDAVLEELRRLRRGAGSDSPPAGRVRSNGAVSAAEVAEAILTGRFSVAESADGIPGPGTTLAASGPAPLVRSATRAPSPPDSSVVSLPGASADSLARSDPDRTFFRSVARIGLQVAEALEYANRQGVLHRDVKPSNLLLDPKGNVWVADFGLAKAADAEDITHSGDIVGTVRYMAPERFVGKCDARSDVYALGLTLYELLALRPAFEASDRHELMRRVMSEDPERLRGLVPHLPRDMETIVQKAIDRDPARRYSTAAALAEDLQRFLDDKPIKARRVTVTEQAWRWARRNPAVSSLAAGLLLALLSGLIGVTWQWRQATANLRKAEVANEKAQTRFDLAMEAVQAFTTGASEDVLLHEKQLEGLRNKLLEGSLRFYDRLALLLEGETGLVSRRSLAQAIFDAGELNARVGRKEKALEAHRMALTLREALEKEAGENIEALRNVLRSNLAVGETLVAMGRIADARQAFARLRKAAETRLSGHSDDHETRALVADGDLAEGRSLIKENRLEDAKPFTERALKSFDELVRASTPSASTDRYLRGRAKSAYEMGYWADQFGSGSEALSYLNQAVADYETLTLRFPNDLKLWIALARCHRDTGQHLGNQVDDSDALRLRHGRRAIAILERLARDNPTAISIQAEWAAALCNDANAPPPGRELSDAWASNLELCIRVLREVVAADPNLPEPLADLGRALMMYGSVLRGRGRPDEGLTYLKEARSVFARRDFNEPGFRYIDGYYHRLQTEVLLAYTLAAKGQLAEALDVIRQGSAMCNAASDHREAIFWGRTTRGRIHLLHSYLAFAARQVEEAADAADRADAVYEKVVEPTKLETWDLAAMHLIWFMEGRREIGPSRRAPGPP